MAGRFRVGDAVERTIFEAGDVPDFIVLRGKITTVFDSPERYTVSWGSSISGEPTRYYPYQLARVPKFEISVRIGDDLFLGDGPIPRLETGSDGIGNLKVTYAESVKSEADSYLEGQDYPRVNVNVYTSDTSVTSDQLTRGPGMLYADEVESEESAPPLTTRTQKAVSDIITTDEGLQRERTEGGVTHVLITVVEGIPTSGSAVKVFTFDEDISDVIGVSDSSSTRQDTILSVSDTTVVEDIRQPVDMGFPVGDTVEVGEDVPASLTVSSSFTETIEVQDQLIRGPGLGVDETVIASDYRTISRTEGGVTSVHVMIEESTISDDDEAAEFAAARSVDDTIHANEGVVRGPGTLYTDEAQASDSADPVVALKVTIVENLTTLDEDSRSF